jgi:hypothetical protein
MCSSTKLSMFQAISARLPLTLKAPLKRPRRAWRQPVSGELPGGVVEEVGTLSELELELEVDAGLNDAEAPAGSPLTLSETEPLKPVLQ